MRLADGQDEAELAQPLHPHVPAHLGIASAAQNSTLLPVEVAARVFGPELCFTSTIVTGADDVAHFVLTLEVVAHLHTITRRHLFFRCRRYRLADPHTHTLAVSFSASFASGAPPACSAYFISYTPLAPRRGARPERVQPIVLRNPGDRGSISMRTRMGSGVGNVMVSYVDL